MIWKKIKELLVKNSDLLMVCGVVFLAFIGQWIGSLSLLVFLLIITGRRIYRMWDFMKPFTKKQEGFIYDMGVMWEREQLGYDLDDPYWIGKKRPTILQKLRGINPNWTKEENVAWRERVIRISAEH
jgi:hypothetical protein